MYRHGVAKVGIDGDFFCSNRMVSRYNLREIISPFQGFALLLYGFNNNVNPSGLIRADPDYIVMSLSLFCVR